MDRKWWTLVVVCAATFMLLLDVTIVIVALPEIQRGLHSSFSEVQWVIDAYALTLASVLLTTGSLADRYGRRRLFTVGLVVFTLGSLLCGVAQSPAVLIASRSIQGLGGATLFSTSLALLAQTFTGRERGVAFGVWGAITGVASGLGPVLGGVIATGFSWRGIFLVNLPVGVAAIAITRWRVEESRAPEATRPDWAGFAFLSLGLVSLVYGLIRAGEIAWSNAGVIACLGLAAAALIGFVVAERRAAHPMFNLALFRIPTFSGGLAAAFAMNGSLFAMTLYFVLFLQDDLGYSALGTGLRLLVTSSCSLVVSTIAGRLSSQISPRWLIGPGLALVGVGLFLVAGLDASTGWTHLIPGFIVAGVGTGMVNPPLASTAVGVVAPARAGMASGVNTTFRQIGLATGIAAYGSIFTASLVSRLRVDLDGLPGLHGAAAQLSSAIEQGRVPQALSALPSARRQVVLGAIRSGFATSLDTLVVVSGGLALLGALSALVAIRPRDFFPHTAGGSSAEAREQAAEGAMPALAAQ